ncbi:UNVERIFIED_CONTAM: hypothetical protein Sradi_6017200 [Sesamum radiatum]|uniref:SWIM-type domain-containing protein n=1 Tax=Sesamum radiatum TaxID=300843 RepID=A0AAW2KGQ1_SESRA
MPIKKDRDLQYFFNPMTGYVSIDIFVQAEKIREMVVPDDPAVSEWGPSDYAGTSSPAGPSVSSEQDDEPEADSMLNNEHVDSEPDEVEVEGLTTNNPENNDEVSIEVMIDVLGNTASGPRSQRQDHFDLNMPVSCEPTNLYSVIPFFEAMHPEDFSVRFARREYRVVESKPKLWKVACKYDEQTGCSWMLRGIFQPNMGLFKITKYAGPHTCLMNEISVEHAREQVYGTWESSVKKLPRFMAFLQKLNPGTVVEWLNLDTDRPDANQQVLPLAFALVDEESLASWRWFLQMLAKHLLPNDDDRVCLISDRHSGLISAINYVPAFKFPRGVHRFCLRHVCVQILTRNSTTFGLKDLCWRAGAEVNARKFERIMTEIRELNEEAYNWLEMIDKTQWTLSHDSGWRTGILTTNMSECVNGVLKGARRLPIVAIVQITFHRSVRYFLERTTRCHRMLNANQEWADFAFRIFEARQAEAVHYIVQKFDYNQQSASVLTLSLTGQGSHTYVVKLKHKTCSCGKWGTHGILCSHAIQVSRHFGVNASNFIPQYYSIRAYRKTYQGRFEPLYGEEYWDPVDIELVHNPAVRVRRGPGRYVSTRIPNEMDRPQARARQQYQSRQV